jgi:hypothetical protein
VANLVWTSLYNEARIEGPFLSYWHEQRSAAKGEDRLYSTRKFSEWMFGLEQVKAGRFGKMQSNNILEAALKVKNEKYNRKEEDEQIIM